MPRAKRITLPGHYYLVIARSTPDCQLFYDRSDYDAYLDNLHQMARDQVLSIYAFCLLSKELRLVIKPNKLTLPRIMQRLHGSHTLRINKQKGRRGHLFEGRFHSFLFTKNELPNVVRSVHLWPVRIGLYRRAESHDHSSHQAYISESLNKEIVNTERVLLSLANNIPIARKAFERFVESAALENDDYGFEEQIKPETALTNSGSIHAVEAVKVKNSLQNISKRVALLLNVNPSLLLTPSRRQDLVMARRLLATSAVMYAQKTVTEVAHFLNRDKAQISRLVSQGIDLIDLDEPFRVLFETLKTKGTTTVQSEPFTECNSK